MLHLELLLIWRAVMQSERLSLLSLKHHTAEVIPSISKTGIGIITFHPTTQWLLRTHRQWDNHYFDGAISAASYSILITIIAMHSRLDSTLFFDKFNINVSFFYLIIIEIKFACCSKMAELSLKMCFII